MMEETYKKYSESSKRLIELEQEISRLQKLKDELEGENQRIFLENTTDSNIALEVFLKRCRDIYELGAKHTQEFHTGINGAMAHLFRNFKYASADTFIQLNNIGTIEKIFTEVYKLDNVLTTPNPLYSIKDGKISGFTKAEWRIQNESVFKNSQITNQLCEYTLFPMGGKSISEITNEVIAYINKCEFAHLYSASIEVKSHEDYKQYLSIKGVFKRIYTEE
jgi:hypothetical protein